MDGLVAIILNALGEYGAVGLAWSVVGLLLWVMYRNQDAREGKAEIVAAIYKSFTEEYKELVKQNSNIIDKNTAAIERLSTLVDERTRRLEHHG